MDVLDIHFEPDEYIRNLSVAQRQLVEIMKAVSFDSKIIIFDEPTAVLTPQEIVEFINICNNLRNEGKSIIIITHKLDEIKKMAQLFVVESSLIKLPFLNHHKKNLQKRWLVEKLISV